MFDKYFDEIVDALAIRKIECKLLELFNEGKLNGTVHTCVGQELTGVFVSKYLVPQDFVVSNHRGHGHYYARTKDARGLFSEILGLKSGCSGGMGGSQHFYNENYLSNGIQGGMVPIAAGAALSEKDKAKVVSVAYIGDGTLGQGVLYEAMHLSSIYSIPLVVILENNKYSQSTPHQDNFRGSIKLRAEGFGFKYFNADTYSLDGLDMTCKEAIGLARNEQRPVLLEIDTYRLNSHSKGDDNRYKSEIEEYARKDVLNIIQSGNVDEVKKISDGLDREIDELVADLLDLPRLESVPLSKQQLVESVDEEYNVDEKKLSKRINELIYDALCDQFNNHEQTYIIGEDIRNNSQHTEFEYGGAFKVTKNLSDLYPDRVLNSSISEAGIVGLSTGLALKGNIAIVEIMFGDFVTLILDQLHQHACKFSSMYNGKVKVPLIVRTPMGGRRGYGPTHSQSIEAIYNNVIGLDIIALNSRIDPQYLYEQLFSEIQSPTLVIENKVLYTKKLSLKRSLTQNLKQTSDRYPTFKSLSKGKADVTIFCYGGILDEVEQVTEKLFKEYDIKVDIICPTLIKPINSNHFVESVKVTGKLLTIEEGSRVGGVSGELISQLTDLGVSFVSKRISNENVIPSSLPAEMFVLPSANSLIDNIKEFLKK